MGELGHGLYFHPERCTRLPVTRNRKVLDFDYELHKQTLDTVTSAKYLGITVQQEINWDNHTDDITAKASRTLGFLRQNLKISSIELREKVYLVFVRPLLEYASSVWDPYTKRNIDKIEAIQRRAARFVLNCYHNTSSVSAVLELDRLDRPTLQQS